MTPNDTPTEPSEKNPNDGEGSSEVSDSGGDSDPAAAAASEPTGVQQAEENQEDESPA